MIHLDIFWMLHAPFWQKMYFAGAAAGVATFIYLMFETITIAKHRFRAWKTEYITIGWPKTKAETIAFWHLIVSQILKHNSSSELEELECKK